MHGEMKSANVEKDYILLGGLSKKNEYVCSQMLLIQ